MAKGIGLEDLPASLALTDLVGLEELQKLQDCFAVSNNVASVILDPQGNVLTKSSNFSDFCKILRSSSSGTENCRNTASNFFNNDMSGKSSVMHCPFIPSLMEAFVPVVVNGRCLAVWNIGQVVDISVEADDFTENACCPGVGRKDIVEAYGRLPRMSVDDFKHIIGFLELISLQVSMLAVRSLEHKILIDERDEAEKALSLSRKKLDMVLDGADFAMWDWNLRTGEFSFDDRWAEMLGYGADEIGHNYDFWMGLVYPDDLKNLSECLGAHLSGQVPLFKCEYRMRTMRGNWKWFHDSGKIAERNETGTPLRVTGTHIDITGQKMVQDKLGQNSAEQNILLDNIDIQIWYMKDAENYGRVNKAHADFIGLEKKDVEGTNLSMVCTERSRLEDIELNKKVMESKNPMETEEWRKNSSGEDRLLFIVRTPILDKNGKVEYIICTATDMTERREYERKLAYMAIHDPLTGCYNRHSLDKLLKKETGRSRRYKHPIEILMIDINRFKEINDRFGHQTGDIVLKEVATLLQKEVRECDLVVRYGGDEFLIILPETSGQTGILKDRVNRAVQDWNIRNNILTFPLSLSIGCAHWDPAGSTTVDDVLAEADKKMYEEKQKGHRQDAPFIKLVTDHEKMGTYRRIVIPPGN